jgi:hypothetical protein
VKGPRPQTPQTPQIERIEQICQGWTSPDTALGSGGSRNDAEVTFDGPGDTVDVTGGEQVEERATQDGEQERAFCLGFGCSAAGGRLSLGK